MSNKFSLDIITTDEPIQINGNTVSDYTFVGAILCYTMQIANKNYDIQLQNGQTFYNGDYSQPSNTPTLYTDCSDKIFSKLSELSEKDFDSNSKYYDYTCEIAKKFGLSVTELFEIYHMYQEVLADAKNRINSLVGD